MSASSQATEKKLFFGLKRSKPEPVDRLLCMSHDQVDLPDKFSLRDKVKQVYDQLNLSSCSANAAVFYYCLIKLIIILVYCTSISVRDILITTICYQ